MYKWKKAEEFRKTYPVGTRVRLVKMDDTQAPPAGTLGTVRFVDDAGTIHVNWDNGSSLGLVVPYDEFVIVQEGEENA